jgi:uncharacterized lipoprotein YddW (UPF0748 family)
MIAISRGLAIPMLVAMLCVGATGDDELPSPFRGTYFHPDRIIRRDASPIEQLAAIREALDRMQRSGFNAVCPYFTGSAGQAYYASTIHAERVYSGMDPLSVLTQEARRRGLQVYPVVCATVCGNDKPAGILREHPDWALRNLDGSALGYISPAHPEAREWLAGVVHELVKMYRPNGILLDYIRYHNRPLRLDQAAEARFNETVPANALPDARQKLLQQFKEDELTKLVRLYRETTRAARPSTRLGIYCWGPHVAADHQIAQCWPRWVKEGYLDFVNVSGYYHKDKYGDKFLAIFEEKMRAAVALNMSTGQPVPLSFALGVETSHGKVHSADDIRVYLRKSAEVRLDGFIFFTWDTLLPYLKELDETNDTRDFPKVDDTSRLPSWNATKVTRCHGDRFQRSFEAEYSPPRFG